VSVATNESFGRDAGGVPGIAQSIVQHPYGDSRSVASVTVMNSNTIRIQANNGMYFTVDLGIPAGSSTGHYIELLTTPILDQSDWLVLPGGGLPNCDFQLINMMDWNYFGVCPDSVCPAITTSFALDTTDQPAATFTEYGGDPNTMLQIVPLA